MTLFEFESPAPFSASKRKVYARRFRMCDLRSVGKWVMFRVRCASTMVSLLLFFCSAICIGFVEFVSLAPRSAQTSLQCVLVVFAFMI
jgi:hypothetical protein